MSLNAGLVIPRTSAPDLVARVRQAEERGVPRVWSTAGGAGPDPLTVFAAAATATSRIGLGTAVVPTYPRHPVVVAAQAIAVDELGPGRLRLGVGPSHKPIIEDAFGLPMGKPLSHLREYVTVLKTLLREGAVEFSGDSYRVTTSLPPGTTPPNIPVPISALRPNAFRLAGEVADGAISWVTPVDYLVRTALPQMQAGADAAGRERPPLIAHVPVVVTTDRAAARAAFRAQFPFYSKLPFYAAMFAEAGFPVTAAGEMTDDLVANLAVSGSPEEIRERLAAIRARGIDELMISHVVVADAAAELAALSEILAAG